MKTLAVLIILTALGIFGTHFFGLYAMPGLEDLPTVETLGKERRQNQNKAADTKESGIFPVKPENAPFKPKGNSAAGQRAKQINANQNQIAPKN